MPDTHVKLMAHTFAEAYATALINEAEHMRLHRQLGQAVMDNDEATEKALKPLVDGAFKARQASYELRERTRKALHAEINRQSGLSEWRKSAVPSVKVSPE